MNWGLLLVGIHGASASTLAASLLSEEKDSAFKLGSYWCKLVNDYPPEIYNLKIGGWDYRYSSLNDAVNENDILQNSIIMSDKLDVTLFPAVIGPSDYAARVEGNQPSHSSFEDAVLSLRNNINEFNIKHSLDRLIVINMSSPMYCGGGNTDAGWSSITAYAMATIQEGADWVEFTPSDSITSELLAISNNSGSHIAGRDGSTGQTILKLVLRDFLQNRGLSIESWYSTNLIGNRDGLVLSHDDYKATKLRDKTNVLPKSQEGLKSHLVEIQFIPPTGDNKESWDCVYFRGWLNSKMSLRINWHGADSFLAAPLALDIISGLIHAYNTNYPSGIVPPLGLFFKSPIGYEHYTFVDLYKSFKDFVNS